MVYLKFPVLVLSTQLLAPRQILISEYVVMRKTSNHPNSQTKILCDYLEVCRLVAKHVLDGHVLFERGGCVSVATAGNIYAVYVVREVAF